MKIKLFLNDWSYICEYTGHRANELITLPVIAATKLSFFKLFCHKNSVRTLLHLENTP